MADEFPGPSTDRSAPRPGAPGYPSVAQVVRVTAGAMLLSYLLVGVLHQAHAPRLAMGAAELVLLGLAGAHVWRHRLQPESVFLLNAVPPTSLLLVGLAAVAASLLVSEFDLVVAGLLQRIGLGAPLVLQRSVLELHVVRTPSELLVAVLCFVLAPAVCEEAFFRGFVYTGLCAHRGAAWAMAGSSLMFGLAHLNPWQLPALVLFGAFLSVLVYWTHTVHAAVLAHGLNNLLFVVATNLHAHRGVDSVDPYRHVPLPVALAAAVMLGLSLRALRRQSPSVPLIDRRPTGPASLVAWTGEGAAP